MSTLYHGQFFIQQTDAVLSRNSSSINGSGIFYNSQARQQARLPTTSSPKTIFFLTKFLVVIKFAQMVGSNISFDKKLNQDIIMMQHILRFLQVHRNSLKCLCTLYLINSILQIFIHEKLSMKLQLNNEKTHVDPWSHIANF